MKRRFLRVVGALLAAVCAAGIVIYVWFPGVLVEAMLTLKRSSAGFARHEVLTPSGVIPYIEAGSGPTVLLLHGLEDRKETWIDFARELTDHFHVVIPDMHGFGENRAASDGDYRPPVQARRMHEFLVALHVGQSHIAGVSMGGEIAAAYAAQFPGETFTLALISAAGAISDTTTGFYRRLRAENLFRTTDMAMVDRLLALIADSGFTLPGFVKRAVVAESRERAAQWDTVVAQLMEPSPVVLTDSLAPGIAARTLVMWGAADSVFHVSTARRLMARLPHGELAILPDCGHFCVATKAKESGMRYRQFLENR